jgi:hypothetical protein
MAQLRTRLIAGAVEHGQVILRSGHIGLKLAACASLGLAVAGSDIKKRRRIYLSPDVAQSATALTVGIGLTK